MSRHYFVTGTDTGVGKTLIASALLDALRRTRRVIGMKPVAAGLIDHAGARVSEDVLALEAASNVAAPRALVNPYAFEPAIAPHLAARASGVGIDLGVIARAFHLLTERADTVIVEGAGGLLVPLTRAHDFSDLARELDLGVILVVGMRLGCLNHARLTAHALETKRLAFTGWVANVIDPAMSALDDNITTLRETLRAPPLGVVPYLSPAACARAALHLDVSIL